MGLLFSRSAASELVLPRELQDASVSENEARSSGALRVLSCPSCQRRLCRLDRVGQGTAAVWKVPASRVERALFGGGASIKCRMCGQGRITVETLGDAAKTEREQGSSENSIALQVALKATGSNAFRPFSVCVCGMYESVVARAAALLQAESITAARQLNVSQRVYKRSELAKLSENDVPKPPMELLVIAHKISGQRNPLTDQHGLYNHLLKHAWSRAEVVLLCLFDVPPDYFAQLLSEQPTLRGLMSAGRLLPLFSEDAAAGDDIDPEAGEAKKPAPECRPQEEAEAAWWIVRCLDGRIPRHEGLPGDNGRSSEVAAIPAAVASERKEGGKVRAEHHKTKDPEEVARGAVSASCTVALLARVAEDFEGLPLVKD